MIWWTLMDMIEVKKHWKTDSSLLPRNHAETSSGR